MPCMEHLSLSMQRLGHGGFMAVFIVYAFIGASYSDAKLMVFELVNDHTLYLSLQ